MAANPFVFNRPVDPQDLVDRDTETEQLLNLAEGGHAVRLSAPRRYGKTSLLRRVKRDAEDDLSMAVVAVDFYGVLSMADIATRIETAYRANLQGPLRRAMVAAIRVLRPRARVGVGVAGLEIGPELDNELTRLLTGLLDLPLRLYEREGRRTLVLFDEFQSLLNVRPDIDGLFRSRIQHHGEAASYVFAGSHPGMMAALFNDRERPLFGQARALHLAPLSDADLADHIVDRFARTGREVEEALEPLLDLASGHPQRAILLAHHLWEHTPERASARAEEWEAASRAVFEEVDEALEATWGALEVREQAVMAALAAGDDSLYSRRTLTRFNISKASAQSARDRLLERGHLHGTGREVEVVDPLLGEWLRRRFAGPGAG